MKVTFLFEWLVNMFTLNYYKVVKWVLPCYNCLVIQDRIAIKEVLKLVICEWTVLLNQFFLMIQSTGLQITQVKKSDVGGLSEP